MSNPWERKYFELKEKLKTVEAERLDAISSGANMMKLNMELTKQLHALEKIAREGFDYIYNKADDIMEATEKAGEAKKQIEELDKNHKSPQ